MFSDKEHLAQKQCQHNPITQCSTCDIEISRTDLEGHDCLGDWRRDMSAKLNDVAEKIGKVSDRVEQMDKRVSRVVCSKYGPWQRSFKFITYIASLTD